MLPTTRFSNLRRFTRIAQCVTAVARLCKSITPNADCYFLLLKCCQSEKRKIDSIAAVRKPLAALAKTGLYLAGPSFAAGIAPSTVSYASHPKGVANFPRKRFPLLDRPPCSVKRWRRVAW
jgi:hypothetical protein